MSHGSRPRQRRRRRRRRRRGRRCRRAPPVPPVPPVAVFPVKLLPVTETAAVVAIAPRGAPPVPPVPPVPPDGAVYHVPGVPVTLLVVNWLFVTVERAAEVVEDPPAVGDRVVPAHDAVVHRQRPAVVVEPAAALAARAAVAHRRPVQRDACIAADEEAAAAAECVRRRVARHDAVRQRHRGVRRDGDAAAHVRGRLAVLDRQIVEGDGEAAEDLEDAVGIAARCRSRRSPSRSRPPR